MKRLLLFALPMVATAVVLGIAFGLVAFRRLPGNLADPGTEPE